MVTENRVRQIVREELKNSVQPSLERIDKNTERTADKVDELVEGQKILVEGQKQVIQLLQKIADK